MLSLYIHIPFCINKCHYCGFYSTRYSHQSADDFLAGLRHEASSYKHLFAHRRFKSVYIGGGTPTVLSSDQFEHLFDAIISHVQLADDAEFTVEANPNTVTSQNLGLMLEHGVNRLSLGVQSFSNDVLCTLGRLHTAQEGIDAFRVARKAGFSNIGIDLIYGIPSQTMRHWSDTLELIVDLKPEHVSAYSLSLDEGSPFYYEAGAGRFALPDDTVTAAMYGLTVNKLLSGGYGRYEVSNFSLPRLECRHNANYWTRGEYLGLGPGAWSFIDGERYNNVIDVHEYTRRLSQGLPIREFIETVDEETAAREAILLGLRTMEGLDLHRFEHEFGPLILNRLLKNMPSLREAGLLHFTKGCMKLSEEGFLLLDEVLARLSV